MTSFSALVFRPSAAMVVCHLASSAIISFDNMRGGNTGDVTRTAIDEGVTRGGYFGRSSNSPKVPQHRRSSIMPVYLAKTVNENQKPSPHLERRGLHMKSTTATSLTPFGMAEYPQIAYRSYISYLAAFIKVTK
jgi:hypothetical protein